MKDVDDAHTKGFRLRPLFLGTLRGFGRKQILGNIWRNAVRFQFRNTGVQYGLWSFEMPQKDGGGAEPESANKSHSQCSERSNA